MQEPDCILLDGDHGPEYGSSWAEAAYLGARAPAVIRTTRSWRPSASSSSSRRPSRRWCRMHRPH